MVLNRPKSHAWIAGVACLTLLIVSAPARADIYYDTVYLPTSSVVTYPTSSVLATSYTVPTSYVVPTSSVLATSYVVPTSSVVSTSYVVPTSYTYTSALLPTSSIVSTGSVLVPTTTTYRRSVLRPNRYIERTTYSAVPTATYLPTVYMTASESVLTPTSYVRSSWLPTSYLVDDSVVTTSYASSPCDVATSAPVVKSASPRASNANASPANNNETIVSKPSNVNPVPSRAPSSSITPPEAETPAAASPPPASPAPKAETPAPPKPEAAGSGDPGALPQPAIVGDTQNTGGNAAPKGAPNADTRNSLAIPIPGQTGSGAKPNPDETSYRQARRPSFDTRNVLRGVVYSADSKLTEEGIAVVISHVNGKFTSRQAITDADGQFKVTLPDGDWVVKVKMPSGAYMTIGQDYLTADRGMVTDASGRPVGQLVIKR